jgi:hypothetical protein
MECCSEEVRQFHFWHTLLPHGDTKTILEKVLDKYFVYVTVSHRGTNVSLCETPLHAGMVGPRSSMPDIHDLGVRLWMPSDENQIPMRRIKDGGNL